MDYIWDVLYTINTSLTILLKIYLIVIAARYLRGGRWPKFKLTGRI